MSQPLPIEQFSPQLQRHVAPGAPPPLKMMAARGMVPMAPHEMAQVLYQLSLDSDANVSSTAVSTFKDSPDDLLLNAVRADQPEVVLDFIARHMRRAKRPC